MAKQNNTPAPEVQNKKAQALNAPEGFALQNWTFGTRIDAGKFGVIDLETLTPRRAEKLVAKGFPYLKKKG